MTEEKKVKTGRPMDFPALRERLDSKVVTAVQSQIDQLGKHFPVSLANEMRNSLRGEAMSILGLRKDTWGDVKEIPADSILGKALDQLEESEAVQKVVSDIMDQLKGITLSVKDMNSLKSQYRMKLFERVEFMLNRRMDEDAAQCFNSLYGEMRAKLKLPGLKAPVTMTASAAEDDDA